jgi:hypothetical protein
MFPPHLLRAANVVILTLLGAAEEQVHLKALLAEIHAIAGTEIESQFRDSFSDWFNVSEKPIFQAINTDTNPSSRLNIQTAQPFCERLPPIVVLTDQNLSRGGFQARLRATPKCDI